MLTGSSRSLWSANFLPQGTLSVLTCLLRKRYASKWKGFLEEETPALFRGFWSEDSRLCLPFTRESAWPFALHELDYAKENISNSLLSEHCKGGSIMVSKHSFKDIGLPLLLSFSLKHTHTHTNTFVKTVCVPQTEAKTTSPCTEDTRIV